MRARIVGAAWFAAAALACGGATVEVAENGAPAFDPGDAASALVVHDCGASYAVSTYAGVSSGTELLLLGIYSNARGEVFVRDTRAAPHVLALSAVEATRWRVEVAPGAGLNRVLLNGYEAQRADVPPGVEITNLSGEAAFGVYGYGWPPAEGSEQMPSLVGALQALARTRLSAFAGCNDASVFSVGEGPAGERACEGANGPGHYEVVSCDMGRSFLDSEGLFCEDALAHCKAMLEANPENSYLCRWNGFPIYVYEGLPGRCDEARLD